MPQQHQRSSFHSKAQISYIFNPPCVASSSKSRKAKSASATFVKIERRKKDQKSPNFRSSFPQTRLCSSSSHRNARRFLFISITSFVFLLVSLSFSSSSSSSSSLMSLSSSSSSRERLSEEMRQEKERRKFRCDENLLLFFSSFLFLSHLLVEPLS